MFCEFLELEQKLSQIIFIQLEVWLEFEVESYFCGQNELRCLRFSFVVGKSFPLLLEETSSSTRSLRSS